MRLAREWKGTPFIHEARLKGIGADCETFLSAVFSEAGIFEARDVPRISAQWFLNTREDLYLNFLRKYTGEYEFTPGPDAVTPQPGDIICVRHRWVYSHGALVTDWPMVIHCFPPKVLEANVLYNPVFVNREIKYFNPWIPPAVQP